MRKYSKIIKPHNGKMQGENESVSYRPVLVDLASNISALF